MRDKGQVPETLDNLLKSKSIPDAHHDAFKTGFAEGFLKAQALSQRTQGKTRTSFSKVSKRLKASFKKKKKNESTLSSEKKDVSFRRQLS